MLDHCLAVANAKGGVGKTSIAANLAGIAAAGGWRTLAVDLDPQGNLARDLGYWTDSDNGAALARALTGTAEASPRRGVRDDLDVLAGGRELTPASSLAAADLAVRLEQALAALAGSYDLVVLDSPPSAGALLQAALGVAGWVLVPSKADDASIDGLEGLADQIAHVRQNGNSRLQVVGVVLFDLGAGDHRLRADTRHELARLLDGVAPVLDTVIRHSRRAAHDMRRDGHLAHEYERAALAGPRWIHDHTAPAFSTAASGLAGDYQQLTNEVLSAITARRALQETHP